MSRIAFGGRIMHRVMQFLRDYKEFIAAKHPDHTLVDTLLNPSSSGLFEKKPPKIFLFFNKIGSTMSIEETVEEELRFRWEPPFFYLGEEKKIFQIAEKNAPHLEGFQVATIVLESGPSSNLQWDQALSQARELVQQGIFIFWEFQLGLFKELKHPLSHTAQYLSLTLALDHFRQTLWKEFRQHTFGACLYRGSLDFSQEIPWLGEYQEKWEEWLMAHAPSASSKEQKQLYRFFCRDLATDFFHLLLGFLPDALLSFVLLDAENVDSKADQAFLLHPACYANLHIGLKSSWLPHEGLAWQQGKGKGGILASQPMPIDDAPPPSVGVCLPPKTSIDFSYIEKFEKLLSELHLKKNPFRLLAEETLTTQWDRLDVIYACLEAMSPEGKRRLQGFCAAGGEIENL